MSRYKKNLGDFGEYVAADFLSAKGYRVLEKNYRARNGELDLIVEDKKWLIFVEVKTRRSTAFGLPSEAVDYRKQQHMLSAARGYLQHHPTNKEIRFDVIEILASICGDTPCLNHIHHIENIVMEGIC